MPKILIALSSHAQLGDTGRTTGFYVPEAARPHQVFTDAGHQVDFVSVRGGNPPRDGVKPDDTATARFLEEHGDRLATTPAPADIDPAGYRGILFAGGHGTMWDFPGAKDLLDVAVSIYETRGVIGAVCHGPAALVDMQLSDGTYVVDGKRVSSFTDEEERAVGLADVVPFLLETRLRERGALFTKVENFAEHAVRDGRLVTGQNPASAERVAHLMLEGL